MFRKFKDWLRERILRFLQIEMTIKNIVIRESADINKIAKELNDMQNNRQKDLK